MLHEIEIFPATHNYDFGFDYSNLLWKSHELTIEILECPLPICAIHRCLIIIIVMLFSLYSNDIFKRNSYLANFYNWHTFWYENKDFVVIISEIYLVILITDSKKMSLNISSYMFLGNDEEKKCSYANWKYKSNGNWIFVQHKQLLDDWCY